MDAAADGDDYTRNPDDGDDDDCFICIYSTDNHKYVG